MLHGGDDDFVPLGNKLPTPGEGHGVEGERRPGSEDDFFGKLRVEQFPHTLAGGFQFLANTHPQRALAAMHV